MMAGPCRQTKDGPECSGPSLARRPVESRAELLRLSEVDGDGLAVVRPLSLVNFQIVRFRIVVEPGLIGNFDSLSPGLFSQDNHVSAVFALTSSVVNELEEQSNHVSAVFLLISSVSNEL